MQLQQLTYFVEVAESGSINKAAEKFLVTQPNLSKAIMNLEQELKIRIFNRNNRGVTLTDDGKNLYQYARTIMNQIELINSISSKEAPRTLSVASYPIISMARLIGRFYNEHKGMKINLQLRENRLRQVIDSVENSESEIGFLMSNTVQSKGLRNMLSYKNIELCDIGMDTWYANIGPSSPLYDRDEVTMEELLNYPVVRMPDDYFSNLTYYLEIDGIKLNEFKDVVYLNDSAAIVALLRDTDVFRFGPKLSTTDYETYGIRTIPIRNCNVQIQISWIHRKKELLSDEAQCFVQYIKEWCATKINTTI